MENVYEEYLTLQEAANLIGVKIKTLYQWRTRGAVSTDKRYKASYVLEVREKYYKKQLVV